LQKKGKSSWKLRFPFGFLWDGIGAPENLNSAPQSVSDSIPVDSINLESRSATISGEGLLFDTLLHVLLTLSYIT
jgi:hypothetical protein